MKKITRGTKRIFAEQCGGVIPELALEAETLSQTGRGGSVKGEIGQRSEENKTVRKHWAQARENVCSYHPPVVMEEL